MYQVQRKNRIKEELQLVNADGTVSDTITVDLNVDEIAARVSKSYETLGMAQNALQADQYNEKLVEAYGNAVVAVFTVIFGEDGCNKILNFYESNYTEMPLDLFPFINDVIMPKIREASESRKQQLVNAAKATNKHGWRK